MPLKSLDEAPTNEETREKVSGKAYISAIRLHQSKYFQRTSLLGSDTNNSTQLQGNSFNEA